MRPLPPRLEGRAGLERPRLLRRLRELLLAAQRPFVIAGGGGWTPQAAQALQRFAENWKLPVGNAFRFRTRLTTTIRCTPATWASASTPSWPRASSDSDLILAIGPRLGEMTTSGYTLLTPPKAAQKLVHIHASAEELNRVYQADLAINATMNAAARSLEVLTAPPDCALGGLGRPPPRRLRGQPGAAGAARRHRHAGHRGQPAEAPACRRRADQRRRQLCQLGAPLLPPPRAGQGPQDAIGAHQRAPWATACRGHCGQPSPPAARPSPSPATATS
jgi:thiamine pyrophosphate-dependent acetolactate synthase large subunit-like protein